MSYVFQSTTLGLNPIASTIAASADTGPAPAGRSTPGRLGAIEKAYDPVFGTAEFIYLLGVVGTLPGMLVEYDATTFQTTLSPNTGNDENPVAVAMSANVAGQYGWYCIEGVVPMLKTAVQVLPNAKIYQSATAGRIMPTSASGKQILGARGANLTTVTATTSTVAVLISRPTKEGQIT